MKRADFYLLKDNSFSGQLNFCCRLAEKALDQKHSIHIQTAETMQNNALNEALWEYKAVSFLPHAMGQDQSADYPITIDTDSTQLNSKLDSDQVTDLLMLLSNKLPANYETFKRLSLVILNQDDTVEESRQLYKKLKTEGFEVHIHDQRQ